MTATVLAGRRSVVIRCAKTKARQRPPRPKWALAPGPGEHAHFSEAIGPTTLKKVGDDESGVALEP